MRFSFVIKRLFFYLFILVCLLGVFYYPDRFTDRFFTSGMIWMGMFVGGLGMLFPFIVGKKIKFSGLLLGIIGVTLGVALYMGMSNCFSFQTLSWGIALCLFMVILVNSADYCRLRDVYFLLSLFALIEALIGIGQYMRLFERYHSSFPVTGTFENPAGLSAYLVICFPAALYFVFQPILGGKLWGGMVASVLAVSVILSGARTGMIALIVIAIFGFYRNFLVGRKIPPWCKVTMIILGMVFLIGLYLFKKNSADGRLLVWCTASEMFCDAPVLGHGPGSFSGKYMDYQADWLTQHSDERWVWLADNVKHPFNEYLKIAVEYGSIGLLLLILLGWQLWQFYRRSHPEEYPLYCGLLAFGICGMFSYPLNYPAVCVLASLLLGIISRKQGGFYISGWCGKIVVCGMAVFLLTFTIYWKRAETKWNHIVHLSLAGKTEEVLPDYLHLYRFMRENPLFLYNYGAELHEIEHWEESAQILEECSLCMNDTDVQMLLADNYFQMEEFDKAEIHYLKAAYMCPNRFLPLYQLVKLYKQMERLEDALKLARQILEKKVKVNSYTIVKIQKEMEEYINEKRNY